MIVADCNLLAYLLIQGDSTADAEAVFRRDAIWTAPFLWRSEFRNVLVSHMKHRSMRLDDALAKMAEAGEVMRNAGLTVVSERALAEAASAGISAYDTEYVVLARQLSVPLITVDRKVLAAGAIRRSLSS